MFNISPQDCFKQFLVFFSILWAILLALFSSHSPSTLSLWSGIDICSFYLDDGFCAGSAPAVRHFLSALIRGFRSVRLEVNLDKNRGHPCVLFFAVVCSWRLSGLCLGWVLQFQASGSSSGVRGLVRGPARPARRQGQDSLDRHQQVSGRSGHFLFAPLLLRMVQGPLLVPHCSSRCPSAGPL